MNSPANFKNAKVLFFYKGTAHSQVIDAPFSFLVGLQDDDGEFYLDTTDAELDAGDAACVHLNVAMSCLHCLECAHDIVHP